MSVALCCVMVLAILQTANSLSCYKCNSKDNVICSWGSVSSITYDRETCSGGILDAFVSPKCYKITAESKDGRGYVARGCLPSGVVGCDAIATTIGWLSSQSSTEGESLKSLNCKTCETDNCNSAQRITGVTLIGLVLSAVVFLV